MSQILLIVYFWLDNGAMTCGLDFEFGSESDSESETDSKTTETVSLVTGDEQISVETLVDLKILEKLRIVSAFDLVSEEGRLSLYRHSPISSKRC